jgi:hypothetical protein
MTFLRLIASAASRRTAASGVDIQSKSRTGTENDKRNPINIPRQ